MRGRGVGHAGRVLNPAILRVCVWPSTAPSASPRTVGASPRQVTFRPSSNKAAAARNLAKVGVEGSNPFARSNYSKIIERNHVFDRSRAFIIPQLVPHLADPCRS